MGQKICLDTDICISILNGNNKGKKALEIISDKRVFLTNITVFELLLRNSNLDLVENFIRDFEILEFDIISSRLASKIYKELKAKGKIIDMRDIFISSIVIINNCKFLTLNLKHFKNVNKLRIMNF